MRAALSFGFVALLGAASSSLGCAASDDDTANAAGTSAARGGTGGGTGSGGANSATGGTDAANGGTSSNDGGTSSNDAGTSNNGDAGAGTSSNDGGASSSTGGTSSTEAGAANGDAGASGATGSSNEVPYANVVAVTASGNEGKYTFSVSVESSDIDCTQYANWWEVLTEDGALSYRRIIDHSHTDENGTSDPDKPGNTYTRTGGPVPVTADTIVLVRSHMNTGGYNGMVMRGTAAAGFVQAPDIDGNFATDVEFLDPQPTSCAF